MRQTFLKLFFVIITLISFAQNADAEVKRDSIYSDIIEKYLSICRLLTTHLI